MKKNGMQKAVWYRERGLANALSTSFCEFLNLKSASFFSSNFIDLSIYEHGSSPQGYHYINVDGGWWAGSDTGHIQRNASGYFMENKVCCFAIFALASAVAHPHLSAQEKFPGGLANLIAQLHSDGFKWGHYTDSGKHACNKDAPMSQGYEHQDARLFALEYKADMYV